MKQTQTNQIEFKKISELCDLRKGKKVNSSKIKTKNSVPYLLIDTLRGAEPEFFTEDKNYTEAIPEDILIVADGANSGLVGTGVKGAVGSTILRIRINVDDLNKDYLSYFLKSKFQEFNKDMKGTGIPHLKAQKMLELGIRKPSQETQSLIVSAIESNFSKIDNAIKNLKSAKNKIQLYRKAVLKKAFEKGEDWEEKTLNDVCEKITDGSHNPPSKKEEGIKMLSARNIFNGKLILDSFRYISKEDFDLENKRTNVQENDVLLTTVGTIGRSLVVKKEYIPFALQRSVSVLKPKEIINSYLLHYFLLSPEVQQKLENQSRGVAQKGIYLNLVKKIKIAFPPFLPLQQAIVSQIESKFSVIDKVEEAVNNSLEKAEKLKKSILKSAFEGRLIKEKNI
ncbi:restriction endonuclease subunit S [Candidatus Pacearchaeota archaeon]|nr:restriction endonuclease subunit S [Candidatus Pacearchaeota archaeon]